MSLSIPAFKNVSRVDQTYRATEEDGIVSTIVSIEVDVRVSVSDAEAT